VNFERERALRAKMEKELSNIKLQNENQLIQVENKMKKPSLDVGKPADRKTITQGDEGDLKKKAADLDKKVQELRVQSTSLKNDLNKALRVISREIGENFDVDQVLSEENSWKGRAQQIEVLKSKVKDLQSKLSTNMNVTSTESVYDGGRIDTISMRSSAGMPGKADDRRKEMEVLKSQVENMKNENDNLQTKTKAANVRKTVLEHDVKDIKVEYEKNKKILLEKSDNDDKYIQALKQEVEKLKNQQPVTQTKIVYRDNKEEKKVNYVEDKFDKGGDDSKAKQDLKYMKLELDRKEAMIRQLLSEKVTAPVTQTKDVPMDTDKITRLENTIKMLKAENDELTKLKLGVKPGDPDAKMIKDLSVQNAQLRRKIDDLDTKLKKK